MTTTADNRDAPDPHTRSHSGTEPRITDARIENTRTYILSIALVAVFACSGSDATDSTVAGRIPDWSVGSSPSLVIGSESDSLAQFGRVAGAIRFEDGAILVADAAVSELRLYSARGQFIQRLVGRGQGPQELRTISWMQRVDGHRVAVADGANGSVKLVGRDGQVEIAYSSSGQMSLQGSEFVRAVFGDGRLLMGPGRFTQLVAEEATITRDSMTIGVRNQLHDLTTWIGTFPANSWVGYQVPMGGGQIVAARYPLGPQTYVGIADTVLWVADGAQQELRRFSPTGIELPPAVWPHPRRAPSDDGVERLRQHELTASGRPYVERYIAVVFDETPRPEFVPPFSRLVSGIDGEMWVEHFHEDVQSGVEYTVFDRDGVPTGRLKLGPGRRLTDVASGHIVAVQTNDLGVETIEVYQLDRR